MLALIFNIFYIFLDLVMVSFDAVRFKRIESSTGFVSIVSNFFDSFYHSVLHCHRQLMVTDPAANPCRRDLNVKIKLWMPYPNLGDGSFIFPFDRRLSLRYYNFRKYLSSRYKTHRRHRQHEHPSKHLHKGLVWM